jgi:hypothetical protein
MNFSERVDEGDRNRATIDCAQGLGRVGLASVREGSVLTVQRFAAASSRLARRPAQEWCCRTNDRPCLHPTKLRVDGVTSKESGNVGSPRSNNQAREAAYARWPHRLLHFTDWRFRRLRFAIHVAEPCRCRPRAMGVRHAMVEERLAHFLPPLPPWLQVEPRKHLGLSFADENHSQRCRAASIFGRNIVIPAFRFVYNSFNSSMETLSAIS